MEKNLSRRLCYIAGILFVVPFIGTSYADVLGKGEIKKNYEDYCASCHGANLEGGLGPNLIDDTWLHGGSDKEVANSIRLGNLDAGMPAWQGTLTEDQIRAMVVFISEKKYLSLQEKVKESLKAQNGVYKTKKHNFTLSLVDSFEGLVWGLSFLPDGSWLATEREGRLWYKEKNKARRLIKGTPDTWQFKQGGLFDVIPAADYNKEGWVYISYAENKGVKEDGKTAGMTAVARGKIVDGEWTEQQMVFSAEDKFQISRGVHFGSRFVMDDNYLFFSIGDRGRMEMAQDLTRPNGKIHRIHLDGSIPKDNPFVNTKNAVKSIWSYGHRNPQGLARHPDTGELWSTEHGPRGGDEVNLVKPSLNYGWPEITHGINYNGEPISEKTAQEGMEQPKHFWVPSIATAGIEFYKGDVFPQWKNTLLATGLKSKELHGVVIEGDKVVEDEILLQNDGRLRDVAVSPDGNVYIVVNDSSKANGKIYRLDAVK
jgi:glucose/arabinose dehydrogenase